MDYPQIIGVKDDMFAPVWPAGGPGRRKRRRIAAVVVTVLVLGLLTVGGKFTYDHSCRLPSIDWSLTSVDGECVGVTDTNAYAFSPELKDITKAIAEENGRVRDQSEHPKKGERSVPYVKVALMMPMTWNSSASMTSMATIEHSLEGAYTALIRANSDYHNARGIPHIQLLLANEGRSEQQWKSVAGRLKTMTGGEHPLVAVIGMGISIPETADAASELAKKRIATFGAVVTATNINAKNLYKISPSNAEYANSLDRYLKAHPQLNNLSGFLVYDDRTDDNYVTTLRQQFVDKFKRYAVAVRKASFTGSTGEDRGTPALFANALSKICGSGARLVFYAGRDRDLTPLVETLSSRASSCRQTEPITVLSGVTGVALQSDPRILARMKQAKVTLVDASASDVDAWVKDGKATPQAPQQFRLFLNAFTGLHYDEADLKDGYAIMHHDALIAVVSALGALAESNAPTTTDNVYNAIANLNGANAIEGASGTFGFDGTPGGWPKKHPVPIIVSP